MAYDDVLAQRIQAGDVSAVRETFTRVRAPCAAYDEGRGHTRTTDMIDGWGPELGLFALSRQQAHDKSLSGEPVTDHR